MYNLNCVCFSTIVSILSLAVLFTLTIDQDKGKAEKNVPIIVMLFGSRNSSTHGFLRDKLGVYKQIH